MRSIFVLRVVLTMLGMALGVALLVSGRVLLGLLVLALALVRAILFATAYRRRRALGERVRGRRAR